MSFLTPLFFAALTAAAIPVIIHLIQKERKNVVAFPSLMFLEKLPIRTARRRHVTDWPLLALRALALALLVMAFSRPLIDHRNIIKGSEKSKAVVILLDRSMSMGHTGVWPRALGEARSAIAGLGATDRIVLKGSLIADRPKPTVPAKLPIMVKRPL